MIRVRELAIRINDLVNTEIKKFRYAELELRKRVLPQMIRDTEEYIPYNTGRLNESLHIQSDYSGFQYDAPYAKYAFSPYTKSGKMKRYRKETHEKAQGYPLKASYNDNNEKWARIIKKEWKEIVKDPRRYHSFIIRPRK